MATRAFRSGLFYCSNMKILAFQSNSYVIREETLEGRKHIVVPVVMMVEGVHAGSGGPLLYVKEEFGKIPGSWDGIPVSIQHPEDNSGPISANSPEIINSQTVGRIFHTRLDNNRLCAEAWIDVEKITALSPEALAHINHGKPLEVSTGIFTEDDATPGEWGGMGYVATALNYRPDHLALLPGGQGACNWSDGCGIRVNKKNGEPMELFKTLKEIGKKGLTVIQFNQVGFREISQKIQSKLDNMDTDTRLHFLEEVFESDFIFSIRHNMPGGDGVDLFRRTYEVNEDGSIEFTGEPTPVIRNIEFVDANSKKKEGVKAMAKKTCCPEQVNLIIQSKNTRYTEEHRGYLEGLEKPVLLLHLPVDPEPKPQVNTRDQALEILRDELKNTEKFLALASPEIRNILEYGKSKLADDREKLVTHIVGNCNQAYSKEDLANVGIMGLKKLVQALPSPVDHSGMGGGNPVINNEEMLLPNGVE